MRENGAEYLVCNCIGEERKNVLLLYDNTTEELISDFDSSLLKCGKKVEAIKLEAAKCHGMEPPEEVADAMMRSDAVMCITQYSMAHTHARKRAGQIGVAFLSMPEYSRDLLNDSSIFVDYHSIVPLVKKYTDLLTEGKEISVETLKGTKIHLNIENRNGNCCPGMTDQFFLLGSPPDIEANIAPVEEKTMGVLVVDGSITDRRIGLLDETVTLEIQGGRIQNITSADHKIETLTKKIFSDVGEENAYVVGEFGIGLNDCAALCGSMLIDEGSRGCVHFGMGSNWTIGGKNRVPFHLDFVLKDATVKIDGRIVIEHGKLVCEKQAAWVCQ